MAVNLSPIGGVAGQFFDNNGNPLVGGKLYTYAAGTTTPQTTFIDSTGVTPNSNPIILNGGGRVPSEIWLTDGFAYKFVLYSSTDQLIGSWDNISGINSNFVNYTASQEIQTATSGQTVFTLTTMQYQPGTNSLTVYVDGVNQYGPGGLYAYVETSSTVVTFTNGLHVGAEVKFTSVQQATSSATDAAQISYQPAGAGAVITNVQTKLRETVSVKDFGAVGDGLADDTVALENAFNRSDAVIDGSNKTYKITRALTTFAVSNLKIQNLKIDSSSITAISAIPLLKFAGVRGANVLVTANILRNASIITIASTAGITAGQYLFVGSDAFYSAGQNDTIGQIVKVYSIDSATQLTLANKIQYPFAVADNAYVQPLTTAKNITLDNVSMVGTPTATVLGWAVAAEVCENFTVINSTFRKYNYAAVRADRSINTYIQNCRVYDALGAGLAYGFAMVDGCYNFVVDGCYGENLRHLISTGGNNGVNMYLKGINNTIMEAWDSGLDCHANTDHIDYSHNQIEISNRVVKEGIIIQGGNFVAVGNNIKNALRGIYYQSLTDGQTVSVVIANNIINVSGVAEGIFVDTPIGYSTQINTVTISGNTINGATLTSHINVYARGASIFNASIVGNVCEFDSVSRSFYLRASNGHKIDRVSIANNVFKAESDEEVIWLFGDATSEINDVAITGNVLNGGDYSVYFNYVTNANIANNTFVSNSVGNYNINNSSNIYYENEGTWTPVITASTTNPTNITYASRVGNWVRKGKTVTAYCTILFSSDNGGTGYPIITGLPFDSGVVQFQGVATGLMSALTNTNVSGYATGTRVDFPDTTYISPVTNDYVTFTVTYEAIN